MFLGYTEILYFTQTCKSLFSNRFRAFSAHSKSGTPSEGISNLAGLVFSKRRTLDISRINALESKGNIKLTASATDIRTDFH